LVPPPARQAFESALGEDPKHARARFYLALSMAQRGDIAEALADWKTLLAEAPEDAPWAAAVAVQVQAAERMLAEREVPSAEE